jgi:hypothetical protein
LARQEGWICDPWEFEFLFREAPCSCFCLRSGDRLVGGITAIGYGGHGWIGNLIIAPEMRRLGLGRRLMCDALARLEERDVKTVWLTASSQGAPLYEALGFTAVDRIERWVGTVLDGSAAAVNHGALSDMVSLDAAGWGEARTVLLAEKFRLGQQFLWGNGFLIGHRTPSGYQLGPGGGDQRILPLVLDRACITGGPGRVFLDVPAGNGVAAKVLGSRGFVRRGESLLMCYGDTPSYNASQVWALGSMGSIG